MSEYRDLSKFASNADRYHLLRALRDRSFDEKAISIRIPEKSERLVVLKGKRGLVRVQRDEIKMVFL